MTTPTTPSPTGTGTAERRGLSEKLTLAQARARIAELERIIVSTIWMARRYAHGRQSYAVGMYNGAARDVLKANINPQMPDGSIWALDGMDDGRGSPGYSGLSPAEFKAAVEDLNAMGTTPHPDRFSPAGRAALADQFGAR